MTEKNNNFDEKITKFETIAVISIILAGFVAFGYGALSMINKVSQKQIQKKNMQKDISSDTINFDIAKKMSSVTHQR